MLSTWRGREGEGQKGEGRGGAEGKGEGKGEGRGGAEGGGKEQPIRAVHYCPTAAHETLQSDDVLHTYVLVVELTHSKEGQQ